ncbi:zinc finger protein 883 [Clupea harengus]|uniref:Zinc finger protein 883 n=1 Tax=Clupea harengus TaxID=7950 RepID=A0A6P3WBY1_CLUHA|nr:zinc finger protein 883 [Clupea harengus]
MFSRKMNVTSAKNKLLKASGITGLKDNLEVRVKLERSPQVDELVKCENKRNPARVYTVATVGSSISHGIRIKVEPSHDETQAIKEEVTSAEPCPSEAISPKLEPDCEGMSVWAVQIKTEPESDFDIPQPGEADLKPVKREDEGDQDVKLEAPEDGASLATVHAGQFFPCPHCSMSFTDCSYLDKHLKWTHQLEYHALLEKQASEAPEGLQQMVQCTRCNSRFFTLRQLQAHERQAHPKPVAPPPRKRHTCPQCARSFHYLASLQKHCVRWHRLQTVCADGQLSCARCGKSFAGTWGQGPHHCQLPGAPVEPQAKTEADADGADADSKGPAESGPDCKELLFPCPDCGKSYRTMQSMRIHTRSHTGERPCVCSDCGRRFKDSSSLHKHARIHSGLRPFACPHCAKRFGRMTHLNSHLLTHTGLKPFPCTECGHSFSHRTELRNHLRSHSGEKPFRCADCGKDFAIMGNLRVHQRIHSQEKTHQCGECGRKFGDAGVLKKHLRVHTGERPYHCTTCGKRFTRVAHLKNHQRTHTGERPYVCGECSKSFAQSGDLTKHKRTHTGEKPYACPDCPRRYNNSGDLGKHRRSHTGLRPYACQECGKNFIMLHHLKTHMRTHTGERPYLCPHCPLTFSRAHHLSGHIRKSH